MDRGHRFFPLLVLLLAGSGAAALIYEIIWFQLLQLVIGSSAISLGILLGTFMGGMCLGSILLPRMVSPVRHPLRVFALLEMGTAIMGLLILFGMPHVAGLYTVVGGYGGWSIAARALVAGLCLLPPTLMMGAALPAIARWVQGNPRQVSWLGFLYGSNVIGAVFGSVLAGFYLLRVHDVAVATYVAAAINVTAAVIAAIAAVYDRRQPLYSTARAVTSPYSAVHVAIALSGCAALGAEVIWTRLLSLMLGATVYTFSIILAVFLLALGTGSFAGSALAKRARLPLSARRAFGISQILVAGAIAWSAYMLTRELPYWPMDATLSRDPWIHFKLDMYRVAWAVFPAASLWGASFPLALAAAGARPDSGRLVGDLYAANTMGAIAGAIGFSMMFVQFFGTHRAHQTLIVVSMAAAVLMLLPAFRPLGRKLGPAAGVAAATVLSILLSLTIVPVPADLIGYGRFTARALSTWDPATRAYFKPNFLYAAEGLNASVAVSETPSGRRNFHVSGKIEASTEPQDMRLQRMLGHISALSHPGPRSVLVVGFGAGITAGTFVTHPSVEKIVICEIEPLIPAAVATYFAEQNGNVLEDPRVQIVYDDARHYLLTTRERFDVITSDPIHPWVKGAATLYSREYIELARRRLNPGGVVSQWVPLYQSSADAVKSALGTFFEVFPDGTVWSNDVGGRGYDIVLLGRDSAAATAAVINVEEFDRRLSRPDHENVMRSLREVGFDSAIELLSRFAGWGPDLAPWLAGAEINRDRNLRLQYLAGMSLDLEEGASIHESMLEYRRFPEKLFTGTSKLAELRNAIDRPQARVLNATQTAAIAKALAAGPPRRISISAVMGDEEALQYARQLGRAIESGGWKVAVINRSVFSDPVAGILISVGANPPPAAANELYRAMNVAGLTAPGNLNPKATPESVSLLVGTKK